MEKSLTPPKDLAFDESVSNSSTSIVPDTDAPADSSYATSVYIVDEHYHLLHYSSEIALYYPEASIGSICHKVLYSKDTPCESCPLRLPKNARHTLIYNNLINKWVRTTVSDIPWRGA